MAYWVDSSMHEFMDFLKSATEYYQTIVKCERTQLEAIQIQVLYLP